MISDVRAIHREANLPIAAPPVTATQAAPAIAAASVAAEAGEQIGAAISGDLAAASPSLNAKLQDLQDQIDALTPP